MCLGLSGPGRVLTSYNISSTTGLASGLCKRKLALINHSSRRQLFCFQEIYTLVREVKAHTHKKRCINVCCNGKCSGLEVKSPRLTGGSAICRW